MSFTISQSQPSEIQLAAPVTGMDKVDSKPISFCTLHIYIAQSTNCTLSTLHTVYIAQSTHLHCTKLIVHIAQSTHLHVIEGSLYWNELPRPLRGTGDLHFAFFFVQLFSLDDFPSFFLINSVRFDHTCYLSRTPQNTKFS